jgi:ATP-dependent Clp protease ATP-binding subunit ClpA
MKAENFTQKSIEAINQASQLAKEYGNQQINSLHLLSALISDQEGLTVKLIEKVGGNVNKIAGEMGMYDLKTAEEYMHRYGKAGQIIRRVDISKELSPRSRAEILKEVKNSLPEEERNRFGKIISMLKIYLDGVMGV